MSFDELKEHAESNNNSSGKKALFGVVGVGLVVASFLNAGHIEEDMLKIETLQKDYVNLVSMLSPEFRQEIQDYYRQIDEKYATGEINDKEVKKLLDIEVIYDLAKAEGCINKDLRDLERQVNKHEGIKKDRVLGKYFGAIGGSGLLMYSLCEPAKKLYTTIKEKIEQRHRHK